MEWSEVLLGLLPVNNRLSPTIGSPFLIDARVESLAPITRILRSARPTLLQPKISPMRFSRHWLAKYAQ